MEDKLLNKNEERDIKANGYSLSSKKPNGLTVQFLVVISNGNKAVHDSGYPYIKIFGAVSDKELVFLGWHDHFASNVPTNVDSWGKNIFRVMPWHREKKWVVAENFFSCSSFQIGRFDDEKQDFTELS